MDRREAVKRISAILGVAVSGSTMAGIMGGCQADSSGTLKTLNGNQHQLLEVMTEHIIPTTDTPGAKAAGVADYIDAMLTDFYSEENREKFLKGLAEANDEAATAYGDDFLSCSADDQRAFLDDLDAKAFPDLDAMDEDEQEAFELNRRQTGKPFIATLKELTIAGYYTSEVGATQELKLNPMGFYLSDVPYEDVGRAWA